MLTSRIGGRRASRALAALAATLSLAVLTAACGGGGSDAKSDAGGSRDAVTYETSTRVSGSSAGLFYGIDAGIFAKHGIDLKVTEGSIPQTTLERVDRGTIDFTHGGISLAYLNAAAGNSVVGLAELPLGGTSGIMVDAKSPISSWADLKGKKVIMSVGSSQKGPFQLALKKTGVDVKDVKVTELETSAAMSAFASGEGDAILGTFEVWRPVIDKSRPTKELPLRDGGIGFTGTVLMSSKAYVKAHPDVTSRFTAAYLESIKAAYHHVDAAASSVVKRYPVLEKATVVAVLKKYAAAGCGDMDSEQFGGLTAADITKAYTTLTDAGSIENKPGFDPQQAFDLKPLNAIPEKERIACSTVAVS